MRDAPAELEDLLKGYEAQLLQSSFRKDAKAVAALLADEFREFGSSGRTFTKAEILLELVSEAPTSITLDDIVCKTVSPDVALVTYRTTRMLHDGRVSALRSSLWVLREGRWQMLFHQGTLVKIEASS